MDRLEIVLWLRGQGYFWLNSLYIYKIWYKDCSITCHQQNPKIQRELELRMTGGHPDSLTFCGWVARDRSSNIWRLHLFTRYFWLNSLYIYKIWYKDCYITCHQQNSKIQRELELRMTGGHPDSLTSVKVIDLMTTTVLASLFCLQLINCSIILNFIEKNCYRQPILWNLSVKVS